MLPNKEISEKIVHRFTENAHMRFRPTNFEAHQPRSSGGSLVHTFSNILGSLFKSRAPPGTQKGKSGKSKTFGKGSDSDKGLSKNKSTLLPRSSPNSSFLDERPGNQSFSHEQSMQKTNSVGEISLLSR
jgi:hypothetical protein